MHKRLKITNHQRDFMKPDDREKMYDADNMFQQEQLEQIINISNRFFNPF